MKIAYIVGQFPSASETFISREITALSHNEIEVQVFSMLRPDSPAESAVPVFYRPPILSWRMICAPLLAIAWRPLRCMRAGIAMVLRRPAGMDPLRLLRHFFTAVIFAHEAARAGVTHIHAHFAFVTADIAMAMAIILSTEYTVSVHARDLYTQDGIALAKRVGGAARIIACTQHGRAHLLASAPGISEDKVVVVRHGLDLDQWQAGSATRQAVILAAGRLIDKKGFIDLVAACRILADRHITFTCVIAGEGPERPRLEHSIEDTGLKNMVTLAGQKAEAALRDEMGRAAVLVAPSRIAADGDRDGIPNVVLEAMAMRLPVVVTTASAAPEVVNDGSEGYVVAPGNPAELADRIARLLGDPELGRKMSDAGRTAVEQEFAMDKNGEKLAIILEGACRS